MGSANVAASLLMCSERDDDLSEIMRHARCLVYALKTHRAVEHDIVAILNSPNAHWRNKEAICDALVDGRVALWPELREALKGMLELSHKLAVLAALLPLLLECGEKELMIERLNELRPLMTEKNRKLGRRMIGQICEMQIN